jgi:ADP-ribose pyrophosphatase YjhB (NUDIX family)
MPDRYIRAVALCVCRHQGQILVFEGYDSVKDQVYYRPLGGGIEFGELSRDAVQREIREELGTAIHDVRLLGTLENLFTLEGVPGHEIVLIFDATLADRSIYTRERFTITEDNGQVMPVQWMALVAFAAPDAPPLYPDGLYALLTGG